MTIWQEAECLRNKLAAVRRDVHQHRKQVGRSLGLRPLLLRSCNIWATT